MAEHDASGDLRVTNVAGTPGGHDAPEIVTARLMGRRGPGPSVAKPGEVTGGEIIRMLGGNRAHVTRVAREAGMPDVGQGMRRYFPVAIAVAVLATRHQVTADVRRALLAGLPALFVHDRPQFIIVLPGGTLVPAATSEDALAVVNRQTEHVVHLLDVRAALASLEAHLGRSVGWAA